MTPKQPIDFTKVEALRKHMLLTTGDMAELLGVSRVTYYGWVRGKGLRSKNDTVVRAMLKKLLVVLTDHGWPTPEVIAAEQKRRVELLRKALDQ